MAWSTSNDYLVNINALKKKLGALSPLYDEDHCIYRVDQKCRKVNPDAYNPMMVSIGPFHHKSESLSTTMEEYKLRCLKTFLDRTKIDLHVYIKHMDDLYGETRKCYAESVKLDKNAFVEMMLLDGLFIIDLFQKYWRHQNFGRRDKGIYPLLNNSWILPSLKHDILLLENQLPMCVLDDLFKLTKTYAAAGSSSYTNDGVPAVSELSMLFLNQLIMKKPYPTNVPAPEAKHLLDLLGKTLHPSPDQPSNQVDQTNNNRKRHLFHRLAGKTLHPALSSSDQYSSNQVDQTNIKRKDQTGTTSKSVPCVKDLTWAGIKFEVSTSDRLLDIEFKNGTMKIPHIIIDDITDTVLRNLIAYEQCSHEKLTYMISYAYFMDSLINSVEDVRILCEKGIIKNNLGNEKEVCDLFNKLCNHTTVADYYYADLCVEVKKYYESPWHRYIAILRRDYFQNPWTIISFVAAALLLLLTATQAITSVLQVIYSKPVLH